MNRLFGNINAIGLIVCLLTGYSKTSLCQSGNLDSVESSVLFSYPVGNFDFDKSPASVNSSAKLEPFLSEMNLPDDLPVLITAYNKELGKNKKANSLSHKFSFLSDPLQKSFASISQWNVQIPYWKEPQYLRNENSNFWKKAGRGELLIGGVEAIGMACLMVMPKEITKWEDDWIKAAERNLKRAFTNAPVMDQDDWVINYIGHPIAGSYYYNAVRSQNANWWQSLLFATVQSCFWEYVIEGVAEQPSVQDLIITPLLGMAIGEPTHLATLSMRKNGFNFIEKVITFILNPMFVLNNGYKSPADKRARY